MSLPSNTSSLISQSQLFLFPVGIGLGNICRRWDNGDNDGAGQLGMGDESPGLYKAKDGGFFSNSSNIWH